MAEKQNVLLIDTGNTIAYNFLLAQGVLDPLEEVFECIRKICDDCSEPLKVIERDNAKMYVVENCKLPKPEINQPYKLKLSVKVFLYPHETKSNELMSEVIELLMKTLQVETIDQLTISIQTDNSENVVPSLRAFINGSSLFDYLHKKVIKSLGISDLDHKELQSILDGEPKIRPNTIQINLEACCDVPEELAKLAKSKKIELLTHNDPMSDFLPTETFVQILKHYKEDQGNEILRPVLIQSKSMSRRWVARYTFIQTGQGVLTSKGFLVALNM